MLSRDWPGSPQGINSSLGSGGITLRTRGRWLVKNDPYAKKYVRMMRNGVVGPKGVILQAKVKNQRGAKLNDELNQALELGWKAWGKLQMCTVNRRHSWLSLNQFLVSQLPADGEFFVQRVITPGSPFGISLRVIDPDQLDSSYNVPRLSNGNMIVMGVELDTDFTPVAYWFWDRNPYDVYSFNRARKRVPASEVIHYYRPWFVNQARGIPEMVSAMWRMNMLDGYEESELTSSRVAAAKMGFLMPKSGEGEAYTGEKDPLDPEAVVSEATPGSFEILPKDWDFKEFDPQHPNAIYKDFVKGLLRGIASGWGVSYNGLANDLEGVNFSSIRAGLLEERDEWKTDQGHFIEHFIEPVFRWWLEASVLAGAISLGAYTIDQVCASMVWSPRRWAWVDPMKDAQASVLAQENGFQTLTDTLAEQGKDFEETIDQIAYEQEYIKSKGVKIGSDTKGDATAPEDAADGADAAGQSKAAADA